MKLTAATMIISRVCVYHFERFERALKNVSDEIRLKNVAQSDKLSLSIPSRERQVNNNKSIGEVWYITVQVENF